MTPTRQLFVEYHIQAITTARAALRKTNDPVEQARLNHTIDTNTAAVNRLDREAQSADRKVGAH